MEVLLVDISATKTALIEAIEDVPPPQALGRVTAALGLNLSRLEDGN
jgi:hypothetical protein